MNNIGSAASTKSVTMSLARALKEKNRIAKRLNDTRQLFEQLNSLKEDSPRRAEAVEVYEELLRCEGQYLRIKQAISRENAAVSDRLVGMLVLRARIDYLGGLVCAESSYSDEWTRDKDGKQTCRHVRIPHAVIIPEKKRREMMRELEEELDGLQDEVDQYNARRRTRWSTPPSRADARR